MQKYKPVTAFLGTNQSHQLRVLAEATRADVQYAIRSESISSLMRLAVTRLMQDLEEWNDALAWNQEHEGTGNVLRNGRVKKVTDDMIARYAKAHSQL